MTIASVPSSPDSTTPGATRDHSRSTQRDCHGSHAGCPAGVSSGKHRASDARQHFQVAGSESGGSARSETERADAALAEAASAAPKVPTLDSTQRTNCGQISDTPDTPDSVGDRRRIRWAARALLWSASTLKSLRMCGRYLSEHDGTPSTGAGVKRRDLTRGAVAGYSGLSLCGSVWSCPRCSAVVAQQRSEEIGRAVAACQRQGGQVYLLTLTVRHGRKDALASLFDALSVGWKAAFSSAAWSGRREQQRTRAGRSWIEPRIIGDGELFGVAGRVRSTESTVSLPHSGGHGWHLHFHVLLFTLPGGLALGLRDDLDSYLDGLTGRSVPWDHAGLGRLVFGWRVFSRWQKALAKRGFTADVAGFDLRQVEDGGAEFVGSYLAKSTYDLAQRLGMEVASGAHTKQARDTRNCTPFEVLAMLATDIDAPRFGLATPRHWAVQEIDDDLAILDTDSGELSRFTSPGLWALWHEWELASKGRRQVVWSRARGLDAERALLWSAIVAARGEPEDDATVAQRTVEGDWLGEIPREAWYKRLVWRPSWLVGALEAAEVGGESGLREYLAARGIKLDSED